MIRLSPATVIKMHSDLIHLSGGLDGVRDKNLLDSALNAPFQTFDGIDLYPALEEKAAHLGFSLIKNHPFYDGNKRIGILAMVTFLARNGICITCSDDELIALGWGLADGSFDKVYLRDWLIAHTS